jgi:hypothetical protein
MKVIEAVVLLFVLNIIGNERYPSCGKEEND